MKPFIPIVILAFLSSSCMTFFGLKKGLPLVGAKPNDIKVEYAGTPARIEYVTAFGKGDVAYKVPGIAVRMKKNAEIYIEQDSLSGTAIIETRAAYGWLIGPGLFTFGVSPLIDFATGAWRVPKNRFIDVPAILNNEPHRSKKELLNYVKDNYEF